MLAAWRHHETQALVVGNGQIKVTYEYHQMVQPAQHGTLSPQKAIS